MGQDVFLSKGGKEGSVTVAYCDIRRFKSVRIIVVPKAFRHIFPSICTEIQAYITETCIEYSYVVYKHPVKNKTCISIELRIIII